MVLSMVLFCRNVKFDLLIVLVVLLCGYYPTFWIVNIANPTWNEVNMYMEDSLTKLFFVKDVNSHLEEKG